MANDLRTLRSNAIEGLGTHTLTATVAGPYKISCYTTMQYPSGVSITITHNSTTLIVAQPPVAPQQDFLFVETNIGDVLVGDTLNVILASSNPNDQAPNHVKSIIVTTRI